MLKLIIGRKYPFVRLTDIVLLKEADRLRAENEELRARVVAAQQEKAMAQGQSERLRKEKERLRAKARALKHEIESGRRAGEALAKKVQALRQENEELHAQIEPFGPRE